MTYVTTLCHPDPFSWKEVVRKACHFQQDLPGLASTCEHLRESKNRQNRAGGNRKGSRSVMTMADNFHIPERRRLFRGGRGRFVILAAAR